ncbi:hypothetical protein [Fodinibius salsisoli]|uniref:Uncharacterized protein n=1 Tax=Fodinibius salsisoli TaxID=2820877 RepID=A0ABT3PSH2_9BACT|nr:hypothetical protein [Fodinibius salsisoli]MCW9708815.1 hypothetical protein [Fodinibius salsisoli]
MLHVIDHYQEAYKKNKAFYNQQGKKANPIELAKYGIRTHHRIFKKQGEWMSLLELQQCNDPLQTIEYIRFSGKFGYDKSEKAYRPLWESVEGTKVMKSIYDKIEDKRIRRTWEEAKKYLTMYEEGELKLYYEPDG